MAVQAKPLACDLDLKTSEFDEPSIVKFSNQKSVAFDLIFIEDKILESIIDVQTVAVSKRAMLSGKRCLARKDELEKKLSRAELRKQSFQQRRLDRIRMRHEKACQFSLQLQHFLQQRAEVSLCCDKERMANLMKSAQDVLTAFTKLSEKLANAELSLPTKECLLPYLSHENKESYNLNDAKVLPVEKASPYGGDVSVRRKRQRSLSYTLLFVDDTNEQFCNEKASQISSSATKRKSLSAADIEEKLRKAEERRQARLDLRARNIHVRREHYSPATRQKKRLTAADIELKLIKAEERRKERYEHVRSKQLSENRSPSEWPTRLKISAEEIQEKLRRAEERRNFRYEMRSKRAAENRESLLNLAAKMETLFRYESAVNDPSAPHAVTDVNAASSVTPELWNVPRHLHTRELSLSEYRRLAKEVADGFQAMSQRYEKDLALAARLLEDEEIAGALGLPR